MLLPDERKEVTVDVSVFWLLNAQKYWFAGRANNISGFKTTSPTWKIGLNAF